MKAKCPVSTLHRAASAFPGYWYLWIICVGLSMTALGQANYSSPYTITTLAGGFSTGSEDGIGNSARFNLPAGLAVDSAGNIYVGDSHNHTIRKITPAGVVSTLAGLAGSSGSADGTGSAARFGSPGGTAVDSAGNVYVADSYTIRKISPAGVVTTIAGQAGIIGSADGTNGAAQFNFPNGVAVDSSGNVYVSDYNNDTIRLVTPVGTNWVVTTIAGSAGKGGTNDGTGNMARFNGPAGLAVDNADNLYVPDALGCTVRKVTQVGTNWSVATLAGAGGTPRLWTGQTARLDSTALEVCRWIVRAISSWRNNRVGQFVKSRQWEQTGW